MKLKIKMLKSLISVLCAATIATSCVVTSVGAVDEQKIQAVLNNMDDCDNRIKYLECDKARVNAERENQIKKLDSEIKDSEQLLKYLLKLIADGENHEEDCNRVKRNIEDSKEKKKQINDNSNEEMKNLDEQIKIKKAEKTELEKKLYDLLNQQERLERKAKLDKDLFKRIEINNKKEESGQAAMNVLNNLKQLEKQKEEQEREKFRLKKDAAFKALGKYQKWLNQNKISQKDNSQHEQLRKLLSQAKEIESNGNFDINKACDIILKLDDAVENVEQFKKNFEASVEKIQAVWRGRVAKDKFEKEARQRIEQISIALTALSIKIDKQKELVDKNSPCYKRLKQLSDDVLAYNGANVLVPQKVYKENEYRNKLNEFQEQYRRVMEELEKENNMKNEYQKIKKEYKDKVLEFFQWKNSEKIDSEGNEIKSRQKQLMSLLPHLQQKFDVNQAEQFIKLAKETMDMMDKFKQEYEQKKAKDEREKTIQVIKEEQEERENNVKDVISQKGQNNDMTKETFEKLLAGDQDVGNVRYVNGKEVRVKNTCGIHMLTTLKNIYDHIDGKSEAFVQGFNNVIDNYLANGGDKNNVGKMLSVNDFKGFLGKNGIGMHHVGVFEVVVVEKGEDNFDKIVKPRKEKMIAKVKELLVSYMKGKEFAPIGTIGGGHWQLLVQYDEQTQKVLRLDSQPQKAEWVDINTIAANYVNVQDNSTDGMYFLVCDLPFFTRTAEFKNINIDSADEFTHEKQQEIIKNIG